MIKNINNNKNIIISHIADIDGMGSVILAKKFFNNQIDYILCEVNELSEIFKTNLLQYDKIFICDLQINNDAIEIINNNEYLINKLQHFDHHSSMINDNMPKYSNYVVLLNDRKTCGTELFYNYLLSFNDNLNKDFYKDFVEGIRANDTWDLNGDFKFGKTLASIHALIGPDSFIELICSLDDNKDFELPKIFLDLVKSDEDKMQRYIENANKNIYITNYKEYNIAISISEQYRSSLGNDICKLNPEIDFVLIINFERMTCSLRCIKDNIDLGKISLEFHHDGGGHKKAAGFIIDKESIPNIKEYINGYLDHLKTEN